MFHARRVCAGLAVLPLVLLIAACSGEETTALSSPEASSVSRQAEAVAGDWRRELTMADYPTVVEQSSGLYVVLVKAQACQWACNEMSRNVSNVLERWRSRASYGTVDVDSEPELAQYLGIRALPITLLYRDGVLVAKTTGAMPEHKFADWMIENGL